MTDSQIERWRIARERMVDEQIAARRVTVPAVLDAMRSLPRHAFVPEEERAHAYDDGPVSIGNGQTISQPYIVALMTALARLTPASRVLEIGTGCGYQTAVLAASAAEVWSVEIDRELAERAARTLAELEIGNVHLRVGDGSFGWPEAAPFDAIVVTAAPAALPAALPDQLAEGGRLIIPLGTSAQQLWVYTRGPQGLVSQAIAPVRFVPLR